MRPGNQRIRSTVEQRPMALGDVTITRAKCKEYMMPKLRSVRTITFLIHTLILSIYLLIEEYLLPWNVLNDVVGNYLISMFPFYLICIISRKAYIYDGELISKGYKTKVCQFDNGMLYCKKYYSIEYNEPVSLYKS